MRSSVFIAAISLAGTVSLAAAAAPEAAAVPAKELNLYYWWSAASEVAAVDALVKLFERANPGSVVSGREAPAHGGGRHMFALVSGAAGAGRPPDAFQVSAGAPLRPYHAAGHLAGLDEVWAAAGLEQAVPPMIRAMSAIDGHYVALPISIHRNNLIWFNKPLIERHGIDTAALTSWEALFAAAEKLRAAGLAEPLQLGESWTASIAFESIVASQGMAAYQAWINGQLTAADDARLAAAFSVLRRYLSYANADHARTPWDVAIKRVIAGEAAFCLMGDWADGEFRLARKEYGRDYEAIPAPGTAGHYGVAVDGFAQARGVADPASAQRFLRFAASRAAQDAFCVVKGGVPARLDADAGRYGRYQRAAIAEFKAARVIYPSLNGAAHDAFKSSLDQVMARFAQDPDVRRGAAELARAAADSQGRFKTVWSLR